MSKDRRLSPATIARRVSTGDERLLDVNAAAERLSISPWTVRDLIRTGELTHVRIGRLIKVPESSVAALVAGGITPGAQA
jgi:excisionase family DNA binding protein